jgi:addiction module RelE/StbE family toxin
MEESKLIVWRKKALKQVGEILDYYLNEFSLQATDNLVAAIEESVLKASKHPTVGQPSTKKKGVRSRIVKDHYRLFYIVKGKNLFVVAFYDMRQHPLKRKY